MPSACSVNPLCTGGSDPGPEPSPGPGKAVNNPWKGAATPVTNALIDLNGWKGEAQYNSIQWTDGNIGESAPFQALGPISWTRGTLSTQYGMAGEAGLKGTTYKFKQVDLSNLPAGSVGTYYLVNLPGAGSELPAGKAIPGNQHGSFPLYADAQGCAGWDGSMGNLKCAPKSDQKQGTNATAGEFDLFEANMYGFATTSHGCAYKDPDFKGTIDGGKTTCNWGGNVLGINIGTPTSGARKGVQLQPDSGTNPPSCRNRAGPDGLKILTDYYGPHDACYINTLKPIDIDVAIGKDAAKFTTTIRQGSNILSGTQTTSKELQDQADLPWTIVGTSWGGETAWLDGQKTLTDDQNKKLCDPTYKNLEGNCNFADVKGPAFTPTSMYCNGVGPDTKTDCPDDPSKCCTKCGGDWQPMAPRCVANANVNLTLGGITMFVEDSTSR